MIATVTVTIVIATIADVIEMAGTTGDQTLRIHLRFTQGPFRHGGGLFI